MPPDLKREEAFCTPDCHQIISNRLFCKRLSSCDPEPARLISKTTSRELARLSRILRWPTITRFISSGMPKLSVSVPRIMFMRYKNSVNQIAVATRTAEIEPPFGKYRFLTTWPLLVLVAKTQRVITTQIPYVAVKPTSPARLANMAVPRSCSKLRSSGVIQGKWKSALEWTMKRCHVSTSESFWFQKDCWKAGIVQLSHCQIDYGQSRHLRRYHISRPNLAICPSSQTPESVSLPLFLACSGKWT